VNTKRLSRPDPAFFDFFQLWEGDEVFGGWGWKWDGLEWEFPANIHSHYIALEFVFFGRFISVYAAAARVLFFWAPTHPPFPSDQGNMPNSH